MPTSRALLLERLPAQPILAFSFNDATDLEAIAQAASLANRPAILMMSRNTVRFLGMDQGKALFDWTRRVANVPLYLQLDHENDPAVLMHALDLGFDGVMADLSQHSFEVNVTEVARIVRHAHKRGAYVEGQLGRIPGDIQFTRSPSRRPSFEAMNAFVRSSGVDFLSLPFGNTHGFTRRKRAIDTAWIREVVSSGIETPLVLHGSDFLAHRTLRNACRAGIRKINLGPELRVAYMNGVRRAMEGERRHAPDHRRLLRAGRLMVRGRVLARLRQVLTANQAT